MAIAPGAAPATVETRAYRKVTLRLMLCYAAAYLDRVNIGFAKLDMINEMSRIGATVGIWCVSRR